MSSDMEKRITEQLFRNGFKNLNLHDDGSQGVDETEKATMENSESPIALTLPVTPDEIIVNGETFRRVRDDEALEFVLRIQSIAKEAHVSFRTAAWAVTAGWHTTQGGIVSLDEN